MNSKPMDFYIFGRAADWFKTIKFENLQHSCERRHLLVSISQKKKKESKPKIEAKMDRVGRITSFSYISC